MTEFEAQTSRPWGREAPPLPKGQDVSVPTAGRLSSSACEWTRDRECRQRLPRGEGGVPSQYWSELITSLP